MPTSELSASWRFSQTCVLAFAAAMVPTVTHTSVGQEQDADQHAGIALFESKIRPVLVQHCYKCHSAEAKELQAGLYLDSAEGLRRGGDSGPVIDGNRPADSPLLQALRYDDLEMPPDGKLPDQVIDDFARWVRIGAPDPRTQAISRDHHGINWSEARGFWSYRKPIRHTLPKVQQHEQVTGAIDAFVLRKLEAKQLTLNPVADRRTLIRRAHFDLIGLPPTPGQVQAFLDNRSPTAYEQLIDRLLSSPHYGERWGRHWLDVAGYAESNGIIVDGIIPHSWRYRDYVIRALNKDKPYDQFLLEQFAGDELVDWRNSEHLTETMEEALTATGFLRCTPDGTDNQDIYQLEKQWDRIHAAVEVAIKASMGIVLNCCRCHDHKFDPVLQEDYYKLVGLFLPAYDPDNWVPSGDFLKLKWPLRYILRAGKGQREKTEKTLTELGQRIKSLQSEQSTSFARFHEQRLIAKAEAGELSLTEQQLEVLQSSADQRTVGGARVAANLRAEHPVPDDELRKEYSAYSKQADEIKRQVRAAQEQLEQVEVDKIWALWDVSPKPPNSHLLTRGDFESPGRVVSAGIPTVLDDPDQPFVLPDPGPNSTGYRLALARWMVRAEHPLTARVMVNRIWQYHFGRGIVATPDDFGSQGARPTQPELLDWLAMRFVDSGWSIKSLHRLIMTSTVYRQSCQVDSEKSRIDPDNLLLARRTPRRLEAELIRDAMLAAGACLDNTFFGPPVALKQLPDGQYVVSPDDPGQRRRSVYIRVRRTTPVSFLQTFDGPQIDTNVPHRFSSTVPLQSLSLMNNPFVIQSARIFADRLWREEPNNQVARITRAFEIAYSRQPNPAETEMSQEFFADDTSVAVWALFCQGLIASNEFLYVN